MLNLFNQTNQSSIVLDNLYPSTKTLIRYQQEWQMDFYQQRINQFKNNPIGNNKIVFLGNSITEGGGDWNKRFKVENIVNRGISGDITEGVLQRLEEILYYKPLAVFLLIGINDIFNADTPGRDKITPEYVANNIITIADEIKKGSPQTEIYIQTILPISDLIYKKINGFFPEHDTPLSVQIININQVIKEHIDKYNFHLFDLYSSFIDRDGLMDESYTSDGVHLNENGYTLWTNLLQEVIQQLQIR